SLADDSGVDAIENWMNVERWDHWISRHQVSEFSLDVEKDVKARELIMADSESADPVVPLVVARNGQRIPFPTADQLDKGDQVLAIRRRRK
ncbi:MAG: hypothetical protein ACOCXI_08310, partial [Chloroflexota bacterium]